jgi:uncharacterized protein
MSQRVAIESFHPHELEFLMFGREGSGPGLLVTAGIHGGEGTGIWVARELAAWLEGRRLRGWVGILPVANPAAFRKLSRFSPYDELDLNRIFPGQETGTPSMVIAHAVFERARRFHYVIDLHCCGLFGSNYTLALWEEFPFARDLAAQLDIPVVIESHGTRGQLFTELCHAGVPSLIVELAGGQLGTSGGIVDRTAGRACLRALQGLLRRLGILPGGAPQSFVRFYGRLQDVTSLRPALWTPTVRPGAAVTEGEELGRLDAEPVRSPVTGVATSIRAESFVFQGHTVAMVAPEAPSPHTAPEPQV